MLFYNNSLLLNCEISCCSTYLCHKYLIATGTIRDHCKKCIGIGPKCEYFLLFCFTYYCTYIIWFWKKKVSYSNMVKKKTFEHRVNWLQSQVQEWCWIFWHFSVQFSSVFPGSAPFLLYLISSCVLFIMWRIRFRSLAAYHLDLIYLSSVEDCRTKM